MESERSPASGRGGTGGPGRSFRGENAPGRAARVPTRAPVGERRGVGGFVRVLLVERSDVRAAAVATALAAVGAEILRTAGPEAAREAVRAGMRPDLVVIGAALAAFDVAGPAVPRVILAGHGEGVPAGAIRAGALDAVSLEADGTLPAAEVERLLGAVEADRRIALGARLAAAFDASPAGSLIVGPEGTIDRANAAFGR